MGNKCFQGFSWSHQDGDDLYAMRKVSDVAYHRTHPTSRSAALLQVQSTRPELSEASGAESQEGSVVKRLSPPADSGDMDGRPKTSLLRNSYE